MERIISSTEANREFSHMIGAVRKGCNYVITAHGKPIAKIVPISGRNAMTSNAKSKLLARLKSQPIKKVGRWTRDSLYDN